MTVRERLLALRLIERQESNAEYMERLGVSVHIDHKTTTNQIEKGVKSK